MPTKALGAVLAVLIHDYTQLALLLGVALLAFLLAGFVLQRTFQLHAISHHHKARMRRQPLPRHIRQLFGGNRLIYLMCISMVAVETVAMGIEYAFLIRVKYALHDETDVLKTVGSVLALTYLVATWSNCFYPGGCLNG